ncbi:PilC/PilY family type IV pilus protein [Polaromonas sp.]|uniref:pilus assembly protein n=1 Tax=Polaromonas sp. TaxID=1869339 RepID=UPI0032675063
MKHKKLSGLLPVLAALLLIGGLTTPSAWSASTDISIEPLSSLSEVSAKPNLMFILDDSGSMANAYMPDDMDDSGQYGYHSSQCNGVAYNPALTYFPPVKANGTSYANSTFSSAWDEGFAGTGSVNLGTTTFTLNSTRTSTTSKTIGTGSKSFVIAGPDLVASSYTVGRAITVANGGATMTGSIAAWNSTTKTITLTVTGTSGSGTFANWTVTSSTSETPFYYSYSGSEAAMNWTYTTAAPIATTFYNQCVSPVGVSPGAAVFTKVSVSGLTTAQKQNYANWYSFYRKRFLLMRTAVGKAFSTLGSGYRVGFTTINDTTATAGTSFLDTKDFDVTQKAAFYSKLYSEVPGSSTPLRSALAKAGRYFANKATGQTYDPVQYSCQRNYSLLSTDGYWNSTNGKRLDGTTDIGNNDRTEARPMRDSTKSVVTSVTPSTTVVRKSVASTYITPTTWTRYKWVVGNSRSSINVTTQTRTQTSAVTTTVVTDETTTSTRTLVTTDGAVTSDTTTTGATTISPVSTTTTGTFSAWADGAIATKNTLSSTNFNNSGLSLNSTYYSGACLASTADATVGNGNCGFTTNTGAAGVTTRTPTVVNSVVSTNTTAGTTVNTNSLTGGVSDTLADVAQYYYATPLRSTALGNCTSTASGSSQNLCDNTLKVSGRDTATYQHMSTYSIGLGVNGTLTYDKNYLTQSSGAYVNLTNGTIDWPAPIFSTNGGGPTNIDDLWHAAVNGRGQYYSALDASALGDAISGVLTSVTEEVAASSAAATSALELVAGESNEVFKASYTTVSWTGDLQSFSLNGTTAAIGSTPNWSAQTKLDSKVASTRNIYYRKSPSNSTLQAFNYSNLSTDGYASNFDNLCSKALVAAQCASLTPANVTLANTGSNLVNYLRGVRTYEANNATSPLYRTRSHVLGDIINGAPVYVGGSPFSYSDAGYAAYKTAKASRKRMIYVGGNDGMLHAFSAATADGGEEMWAYVPTAVMQNMYKLADSSYGSRHQYFVDGVPVIADIYTGGVWKTILVGGLNSGGNSYYALDITDPVNPISLWEFTDTNLGLSYGNPIVTKRADGTWVVALTSGYNNADGKGHLYIVNAATGALLKDIATTAGSNTTPSGLAKINAWIDQATNNTATRFYGGDLLGNLWRFDFDNLFLPNSSAMLLATYQINSSTPQPITTRPETAEVSGKPVIVVGTGRYLGVSDITDTVQQSIYAVKDPLTASGWGDARANSLLVSQTATVATTGVNVGKAEGSTNAVDWTSKIGWKLDLPNTRERVAINMSLQFNTLAVPTAVPNGDACSSGGGSWLYFMNVASGTALLNGNVLGTQLSSTAIIAGLSWLKLADGTSKIIVQDTSGSLRAVEPPPSSSSVRGPLHRTSWRELID